MFMEPTPFHQLHQCILTETRRRLFEESIPRVKKCLSLLSEAETWYRPNAHSNSVGNLLLHLCGNARQWIVSGLGGAADTRRRQQEFDERGPIPQQLLLEQLDRLQQDVEAVLARLQPTDLLATYRVQGFEESGFGILLHVVEHFSYHVGQITYFVKAHKDLDTGYYAGQNLDTVKE